MLLLHQRYYIKKYIIPWLYQSQLNLYTVYYLALDLQSTTLLHHVG